MQPGPMGFLDGFLTQLLASGKESTGLLTHDHVSSECSCKCPPAPTAGQGVGPAFAFIAQEVLNARWARQRSAASSRERQEGSQRGGRGWLAHRSSSTGDPSVGAAAPGRAAQRGPRAADSRLVLPQSQAAARLAAGAPRRAGSGASMRSSSRSTSLGDDSWFQDYLQECSVEGGQLGRRTRRPEEHPCRMT